MDVIVRVRVMCARASAKTNGFASSPGIRSLLSVKPQVNVSVSMLRPPIRELS